MDTNLNNPQDDLAKMAQDQEQFRITQEMMMSGKKTGRMGWIVVLAFLLIILALFFYQRAQAQLPPELQIQPVQIEGLEAPVQDPPYADKEVWRCAVNSADANQDGVLSREEEESLTELNLTSYRIHIFYVKSYQDLKRFPHLKKVWLGETALETVDLSENPELELVCVQSDQTKELILAVGCYPQLVTPDREGTISVKRVYKQ